MFFIFIFRFLIFVFRYMFFVFVLRCTFYFFHFCLAVLRQASSARRPSFIFIFLFILWRTLLLDNKHIIVWSITSSLNDFFRYLALGLLRREKESSFVNFIKIFQKNPFTAPPLHPPIKFKKKFWLRFVVFFDFLLFSFFFGKEFK